jgi:hypothetical protein
MQAMISAMDKKGDAGPLPCLTRQSAAPMLVVLAMSWGGRGLSRRNASWGFRRERIDLSHSASRNKGWVLP